MKDAFFRVMWKTAVVTWKSKLSRHNRGLREMIGVESGKCGQPWEIFRRFNEQNL